MNFSLLWNNLIAYSLQIGVLVGIAALVPNVLRLRLPGARLVYWYALLAACILLPELRPWKQETITVTSQITQVIVPAGPAQPVSHRMPAAEVGLLILAAGAILRGGCMGIGLWKLRRYRRTSRPLPWTGFPSNPGAALLISDHLTGPVMFGFRHPVVLLPANFPDLDTPKQTAILCHELAHVRRHDWLFTIAEELLRAIFWFHPAIWWLLGEIQLAREQAVDREVVEMTQARDTYVDALLAIAGTAQLDLAPAPLFLRKRHLKERVVSLLKEVRMSKKRLISALAMSVLTLAAACWFVTGAFPLAAEPQVVEDANGVAVEMNGLQLMHRSPIAYPAEALSKRVQGAVVVQVKLDANGEVADATIVSGPEELRRAVLQSVLTWHFMRDAAMSTRQLTINFQLPQGQLSVPPPLPSPEIPSRGFGQKTVKMINVSGLPDTAREQLVSHLPVRIGDQMTMETAAQVVKEVHDFDEHLRISITPAGPDGSAIMISAPGSAPVSAGVRGGVIGGVAGGVRDAVQGGVQSGVSGGVEPKPDAPTRIRVGGNVQQAKLIQQPVPVYPPDAKLQRIQGVVSFNAIIAKDGTMQSLSVISGHPMLVQAAMDAVRQWVYAPTLLNRNPVEVVTQIDVNFALSQ